MFFHIETIMGNVVYEKRCCLLCGKVLEGRSDKKFCDDTCRNNYNYQQNKNNDVIKKVNKSLLYNRNVLKSLGKNGRKIVKRQILTDRDFDFDLMTGVYMTSKKHEYRLLYDYAYRNLDDEKVLILKYC